MSDGRNRVAELEAQLQDQRRASADQIELRDLHIDGLCETVRQQQAEIKRLKKMLGMEVAR